MPSKSLMGSTHQQWVILLTGGPLECEANVLENDVGLRSGQRRLVLIHQLSCHDEAGLLDLA
jgi:hypothetical protein